MCWHGIPGACQTHSIQASLVSLCVTHTCRYTGTWDTICRISREEGLSGFFKGMESKILQTALNAVSGAAVRGIAGLPAFMTNDHHNAGVILIAASDVSCVPDSARNGNVCLVFCSCELFPHCHMSCMRRR